MISIISNQMREMDFFRGESEGGGFNEAGEKRTRKIWRIWDSNNVHRFDREWRPRSPPSCCSCSRPSRLDLGL